MSVLPPIPILNTRNLSIGYKRGKKILKQVHEKISFELYRGELTCLLGPNGVGKSTLLRTIGASQPPLQGNIFLDNKDIHEYSVKDLSRQIGLVLTEKTFAGALRVKELVALGRHPHTGFFGKLSSYDYAIIEKAMADTGITEKKEAYVAELSDGERQKVMIAKALTQESPIIILDEPTSFLDIISRIEIMNLLRDLARIKNKAILLSTHDLDQALMNADKLWLLGKNTGLCCGNPEDLIFNGKIDEIFDHHQIRLDKLSGAFRKNHHEFKTIKLNADPEFYFWTRNLLNRHGYELATDSPVAEIKIIDKSTIKMITFVNEEHTFESFEALDYYLRTLNI